MPAPYLPLNTSDVVIDLSHWENVSQDFVQTATVPDANGNTILAVILKATQGTGFVDPTFLSRVAEAKAAGLLVGAYHFLDGSTPTEQIAHFLTVAKSEAGLSWFAIDWEPYPASQASVMQAATAVASVQAATGRWPVLYMGRYMIPAPNTTLSKCALFLPEYGTRPICPPGWSAWRLWQYTDSGNVPGIGACDRSKFAGTVEELKAWWQNPVL